jgi:hypothetical protein
MFVLSTDGSVSITITTLFQLTVLTLVRLTIPIPTTTHDHGRYPRAFSGVCGGLGLFWWYLACRIFWGFLEAKKVVRCISVGASSLAFAMYFDGFFHGGSIDCAAAVITLLYSD